MKLALNIWKENMNKLEIINWLDSVIAVNLMSV